MPAPVEVFANGGSLFTFDFAEIRGPLTLPPGTYAVDVQLQGMSVLSANLTLEADKNYTAVAHLQEGGGIALNAFENDTSSVNRNESRLIVRHLADAPAVDVIARRWFGRPQTIFSNVSNPMEGAIDVRSGYYRVSLEAAGSGSTAFGPQSFNLRSGKIYAVYAIGALGAPSFQLFPQVLEPTTTASLTASIQGTACGGAIGLSTTSPQFGTAFDVTLSGATPDGFGILHSGRSDSRFLFFRLPLSLGFLGASGCQLYQNTQGLMPISIDSNGDASRSITIPTGYAPYFDELHFQFSFVAPGANSLGLLLTDYATVEKQ